MKKVGSRTEGIVIGRGMNKGTGYLRHAKKSIHI